MPALTEKMSLLNTAVEVLEKKYGKGVVMKLSDRKIVDLPVISTGSLGLDLALGVGGLPCGRIVEIYGPESSGKTTLALHCIAEVQKKGGLAVLIDSEHAFDKIYAKALGIDTESLWINQPDDGEQALEVAYQLINSGGVELVVVDSVAALLPRMELDGEIGDNKIGAQARLMSQALRKLAGNIHKTNALCLFINQLRKKIGVTYGSAEITPGGHALKFYASVRLDIRKIKQIKQGDQVIGHEAKVKIVKNKVAAPFRTASFDLIYGKGISKVGEIIDFSVYLGFIKRAGTWFTYKNKNLGQGKEAVRKILTDNLTLQTELLTRIKTQLQLNKPT